MVLDTPQESVEKLDEQFLESISELCKAYYERTYDENFPRRSLPQNQELTLLLEEIRQTNNINVVNKYGNTLLHLAAGMGVGEIVDVLSSHPQINVNIQNKREMTPLMMVLTRGKDMDEVAKPLIAHPTINLGIRNNIGNTAMMMAQRSQGDCTEIIRLMDAKQEESKTSEGLADKVRTAVGVIELSDTKESMVSSPECSLEDETFRIDSIGWDELILEDSIGNKINVKINSKVDILELPDGTQIFTPDAMRREVIRTGRVKDIMTEKQAQWLLKNTPNNIPEGCKFIGFFNSKDGKIHSNQEAACYWIGEANEKGNPKALFCIDINKVDEEMRPYTEEMIINDYDMGSMMQVRLIKNNKMIS